MTAVAESHPVQVPTELRRKLTRVDCRALEAAGLLEYDRFELIDGELVRRISKSPLHWLTLNLLLEWLRAIFGSRYVQQEISIGLSPALHATNEPEPDAVVLRRTIIEFADANPGPTDLLLVVEVAATTRDYDLGAKAALYASAGIADYWVLDLQANRIVVHREPMGQRYSSILAYTADEAVT